MGARAPPPASSARTPQGHRPTSTLLLSIKSGFLVPVTLNTWEIVRSAMVDAQTGSRTRRLLDSIMKQDVKYEEEVY